jgi:hypothetical protein
MDDKITIIEGPPPEFEEVDDGWALGLNESPTLFDLAITHLRTFNSEALVERCHRAWRSHGSMYLHYRNHLGLEERAPIVAARAMETPEGHMLLLWIRRTPDEDDLPDFSDDDRFQG